MALTAAAQQTKKSERSEQSNRRLWYLRESDLADLSETVARSLNRTIEGGDVGEPNEVHIVVGVCEGHILAQDIKRTVSSSRYCLSEGEAF